MTCGTGSWCAAGVSDCSRVKGPWVVPRDHGIRGIRRCVLTWGGGALTSGARWVEWLTLNQLALYSHRWAARIGAWRVAPEFVGPSVRCLRTCLVEGLWYTNTSWSTVSILSILSRGRWRGKVLNRRIKKLTEVSVCLFSGLVNSVTPSNLMGHDTRSGQYFSFSPGSTLSRSFLNYKILFSCKIQNFKTITLKGNFTLSIKLKQNKNESYSLLVNCETNLMKLIRLWLDTEVHMC